MWLEQFVDSGHVPVPVLRAGIRAVCALRLREQRRSPEEAQIAHQAFVDALRDAPIAIHTDAANRQHYEVPAAFFTHVLGRRLKYSGCHWPEGVTTLDGAEESMLQLYASRARLRDGQRVLDLGCGWGSFSLWAAERYPHSEIVALSNSHAQREFIESAARAHGVSNLRCVTSDVRGVEFDGASFDRVVCVEMFEHMRNYRALLERIARWLRPDGELFVHVFAHRHYAYAFEDRGPSDWMAREFFTGGLMPSARLLHSFQDDLRIEHEWHLDGTHYARTANAWHERLVSQRDEILRLFRTTDDAATAAKRFRRWGVFFLACAELFGYAHGREWIVAHYRFVGARTLRRERSSR